MSVIGIDFGTSFNKAGLFNKYGLKMLSNNYRNLSTPSVALFLHDDKWIFGERAIKNRQNKQNKYIYDTKVMLGRKIKDPIIHNIKNQFTFEIDSDDNDNIKIIINNDKIKKEFSPTDITGMIFENLIETMNLKEHINDSMIIISISAFFNEVQIKELQKACELAHFPNYNFQKEPILASIAYLNRIHLNPKKTQNIVVFDFATYFLNISIIKIQGGEYDIHTTVEEINSKQIDDNIYQYVLSKMKEKYPNKSNIFDRPNIQSNLHEKCEEAKIYLSELDLTDIIIKSSEHEENPLNFTLTVEKFNRLNSELFERVSNTIEKAMKQSEVQPKDIDHLFLVGGRTYIRRVREILKETTGHEGCTFVDPREAVALGACIAGKKILDKKQQVLEDSTNTMIDILLKPPRNEYIFTNNSEQQEQSQSMPNDSLPKQSDIVEPTENENQKASPSDANIKENLQREQIMILNDKLKKANNKIAEYRQACKRQKEMISRLWDELKREEKKSQVKRQNNSLITLKHPYFEQFEKKLSNKLYKIQNDQSIQPDSKLQKIFDTIKNYYDDKLNKSNATINELKAFINDVSKSLFNEPYEFSPEDVFNDEMKQKIIDEISKNRNNDNDNSEEPIHKEHDDHILINKLKQKTQNIPRKNENWSEFENSVMMINSRNTKATNKIEITNLKLQHLKSKQDKTCEELNSIHTNLNVKKTNRYLMKALNTESSQEEEEYLNDSYSSFYDYTSRFS
ncbi:hypothetical protein M9Y10_036032 [Tritrichomonas musculus]|uniref:DnaK protein n=1 Tax=Tritrichomonas musculus TaxID=1915356 RepID=A0ABR2GWP2_9EUKA